MLEKRESVYDTKTLVSFIPNELCVQFLFRAVKVCVNQGRQISKRMF